jgi:hypothetical protein
VLLQLILYVGGSPTFGHPTELVRCPNHAPLPQMASQAGEMMGIRGVIGLGPSACTAFRFGEKTVVGWRKKGCRVVGVSSRLSEMRAARTILFQGVPLSLIPILPERNGGSSHEGPSEHRAWSRSFRVSERGSITQISATRGVESE